MCIEHGRVAANTPTKASSYQCGGNMYRGDRPIRPNAVTQGFTETENLYKEIMYMLLTNIWDLMFKTSIWGLVFANICLKLYVPVFFLNWPA